MAKRYNGTIDWFNVTAGQGWVIPEGQVPAVWVYEEDFIPELLGKLDAGVKINFEIVPDRNPKHQSNRKAAHLQPGWREETAEATAEVRSAVAFPISGRMR
jgi:cold shock CspA family protein